MQVTQANDVDNFRDEHLLKHLAQPRSAVVRTGGGLVALGAQARDLGRTCNERHDVGCSGGGGARGRILINIRLG